MIKNKVWVKLASECQLAIFRRTKTTNSITLFEPNNQKNIATVLRRSNMMVSEEENLQRIKENVPDSSSEDHERLKNKLSTFFKYFSLGKYGWRGVFLRAKNSRERNLLCNSRRNFLQLRRVTKICYQPR